MADYTNVQTHPELTKRRLGTGVTRFYIEVISYSTVGFQWWQSVVGGSALSTAFYHTAASAPFLEGIGDKNPPATAPWFAITAKDPLFDFDSIPDGTVKASDVFTVNSHAFSGILIEFNIAVVVPELTLFISGRED